MPTLALKPWEAAHVARWYASGCVGPLLLLRPVKPQPPSVEDVRGKSGSGYSWITPDYGYFTWFRPAGPVWAVRELMGCEPKLTCPFGKPGELLGIKEAFTTDHAAFYPNFPVVYRADWADVYERRADGKVYSPEQNAWYPFRWRSAAQMPQHLIRHRPTIADIRVMRVGEITAPDAVAAGAAEVLFRDVNDPVRKAAFARGTFDCEAWDQTAGAVDMFLARWEHEYPTLSWGWGIFLEGT